MKKYFYCILFFMCVFITGIKAQKNIDEVVAVVGDEVLLRSEIEAQMAQLKDIKGEEGMKAKCFILEQLLQRKLLLSRAKADSLKVSSEQIEGELERRIAFFTSQMGGNPQKLEEYYNKSIVEIKNEFRPAIKEQLLTEQMQGKIGSGVNITPADVEKYFREIPADSLPYYNTEVEVGQIVYFPKITKEEKQRALEKIKKIREDIVSGAKFSTKAIVYSQDNGSAVKGGDLGMQRADIYVPEFAAVAMKLKKDSISGIVETKFGFHIIQMIERRGEMVHVRHILIKPTLTEDAREAGKKFLDSIRTSIQQDTLTFQQAAYKFSEDEDTRNRGGMLVDMKTNSSKIPVDEMDAATFFAIDKLKVGEISEPVYFKTPDGREAFRILFLKSKTLPHRANMKDDYPKIKQIAQEARKMEKMDEWYKKYISQTYIKINEKYTGCENITPWLKGASASKIK